MNSQKYSKGDWDAAMEKGEEASQGMFLKLKNDNDKVYLYFIQPPIAVEREGFRDKSKTTTKMIANVAVFNESGERYIKLQLAEFAPTHWTGWIRAVSDEELGGYNKLYRLKRIGVAGDKDTKFACDAIRKLTDEELGMLNGLDLIEIKHDGSDSVADWLADFRKTCAIEWTRLEWDEAKALKSIETLFGNVIKAADMTSEQRMEYLNALKLLRKGDIPEMCTGIIDLPEDDEGDFF